MSSFKRFLFPAAFFAAFMVCAVSFSKSGKTSELSADPANISNDFFQIGSETLFKTRTGKVAFTSNAPLENIKAESNNLRGVVDTAGSTFAFTMDIISFKGFNSELQRTHFNENYLETNKYKSASFVGKIIEKVQFADLGTYQVRAKGYLTIHGIRRERIIPVQIAVGENEITITSEFEIVLSDHGIKIPRIVYEKISPEVSINVRAILYPEHSNANDQ
ncbi:MAG TPA: YceI family protein [Bacteroidia bacterium]|nr:YceI family protein [Bacteroidia bacterium]